jgi:hypothetical protein
VNITLESVLYCPDYQQLNAHVKQSTAIPEGGRICDCFITVKVIVKNCGLQAEKVTE